MHIKKHEKYLLAFYNRISCKELVKIEEVPFTTLSFLITIPYLNLIEPFVKEDLIKSVYCKSNKYSINSLAHKYQVKPSQIRAIGKRLMVFKPHKSREPITNQN